MTCRSVFSVLAVGVFALVCAVPAARATTFVPIDDATLARSSDVILIGTVSALETGRSDFDGSISTYVHVVVESVLRSQLDAAEVVLREPGGQFGTITEQLFGVPEFHVGDHCLLFLDHSQDGALRTNQLTLGKFSISTDSAGRVVATRTYDAGSTTIDPTLSGPSSPGSEIRFLDDLVATIESVNTASESDVSAISVVPPELDESLSEYKAAFTFQTTPPTPPARWTEPDTNTPIQYFVDPNGDASVGATGSTAAFDSALAAWTNVATASITLVDGGTLGSPLPHFSGCTGVNRIIFNDPYDELGGSGCSGTIGFGGFCFDSETTVVNGTTFDRIIVGKVVLQSGLSACSGWDQCNLAELLTHEIGHSIGMGHSSENPSEPNPVLKDATMYYAAHFDGRCAAVRQDDIDGVSFAYPYTGPSLTPSLTATATITFTPTQPPTFTPTRTPTKSPTPTTSPTATATQTPTRSSTPTQTPTITPTPVFSATPSGTPTRTGTSTYTSTPLPTNTPTVTATSEVTPSDGISGHVYYYGNAAPVDGVTMTLSGSTSDSATSDGSGLYAFPGLTMGSWAVQPSKSGAINGAVSALDATFVLQSAVGLRSLSAAQALAGDTNGSGTITAIDATLILQYRVGLLATLPVGGASRCNGDWAFIPSVEVPPSSSTTSPSAIPTPCVHGAVSYSGLSEQAKNQDYYGVVFGDVTGNWVSPTGGGGTLSPSASPSRVRFGRPHRAASGRIHVPVSIDGTSPWHGLDLDLRFDSATMKFRGVRRLGAARRALLRFNVSQPGTLKISAASAEEIVGGEPALMLIFDADGPASRLPQLRTLISRIDEH